MNYRRMLIALMAPTLSEILMLTMFAVAIPALRTEFGLTEDVASWLQVAYTLPFVMFMPLYGRLANGIGARKLLLTGLSLFAVGTASLFVVTSLELIFIARVVQGAGAAGVSPLAMAIIMHNAPTDRRGNMLGTWNSIGPVSGMGGPLIGGLLIDVLGWRSIFAFALLIVVAAIVLAWRDIPFDERDEGTSGRALLRSFDWPGVMLFHAAVISLVFYLSSRSITGFLPLTDWRLALATITFGVTFVIRERRRWEPFIRGGIFRIRNFSFASLCVSIRMALQSGMVFVMPLYVTDIFGLTATAAGAVITLQAFASLITMRLGGVLVDRYKSRLPIVLGLGIQSFATLLLAFMPEGITLVPVLAAVVIHGLGSALSLAALHLFALGQLPSGESAVGAGLYSTVRFAGAMFGQAVGGVVLYAGIQQFGATTAGYTPIFILYFFLGLLGAAAGFGLTSRLNTGDGDSL